MPRILVADKIAEEGLALLRAAPGVTFDVRVGLPPDDLARTVGDYDGMLIRSAVKVTRQTLERPGRLGAIARAGVGVDNVDLEAATEAGVLVLNTPDANTISTAEHTIALMLALHRRIPDAHKHVREGLWNRSMFEGDQLAGKTLGVVGFGRIGRAVARRALSFDMKVMVFDPFVTEASARQQSVTLASSLDDLLRVSDCVTLHATLSDSTHHLIGAESLAKMKPGAKLVNCARGALIDESALADALNNGRLAGAAIDVYEQEPPKGSPLLAAKNVVLTPHLAASTTEAQTQVSVEAADALLAYLVRGEIRSAVNVTGMPASLSPRSRAFVDLCGRLGALLSPWCGAGLERVAITTFGDSLQELAGTLARRTVAAVIGPHLAARANIVNAMDLARSRGIEISQSSQAVMAGASESVRVVVQRRGESHEIDGTVFADLKPRALAIDGYRMDMTPERHMALIFNDDRPGVIGLVGHAFGAAGINIADMALSRRGKTALMVLKLDAPIPDDLRDNLRALPSILAVTSVSLPPAPLDATTG